MKKNYNNKRSNRQTRQSPDNARWLPSHVTKAWQTFKIVITVVIVTVPVAAVGQSGKTGTVNWNIKFHGPLAAPPNQLLLLFAVAIGSSYIVINIISTIYSFFAERNWHMWLPGFGTEELRPYKRAPTTEAHKQRLALIRKAIKKY